MSFLTVNDLTAGYGARPVIQNVSFTAETGTITGILGANGCGKTTLLKAVCGLIPHTGACTLNGQTLESLPPRKLAQLCGYVPQRSGITIDLSALDVVLMGFNPWLRLLEHPSAAMVQSARDALSQVGLSGREDENYLTLSEGQKQLCILARTLISSASLLLLDEPESALDFSHRYALMEQLRTWTKTRAAVVILHDPVLALNTCDRILLLAGGGVIDTLHPASDDIAHMESSLRRLYSGIALLRCPDHSGRAHLVMLRQREESPCRQ